MVLSRDVSRAQAHLSIKTNCLHILQAEQHNRRCEGRHGNLAGPTMSDFKEIYKDVKLGLPYYKYIYLANTFHQENLICINIRRFISLM